jgi:hypothetical protein
MTETRPPQVVNNSQLDSQTQDDFVFDWVRDFGIMG